MPKEPSDISILVIDKNLGHKKEEANCLQSEVEVLQAKGYSVDSVQYVPSHFNGYDIIIANPYSSRITELIRFHAQLPDTPLVVFGGLCKKKDGEEVHEVVKDAAGVYVPNFSSTEDFVDFIDKVVHEDI